MFLSFNVKLQDCFWFLLKTLDTFGNCHIVIDQSSHFVNPNIYMYAQNNKPVSKLRDNNGTKKTRSCVLSDAGICDLKIKFRSQNQTQIFK